LVFTKKIKVIKFITVIIIKFCVFIMKKLRLSLAIALTTGGFAVAGLVGSKHDLSTATTDEPCVFCHTPHYANDAVTPLWNRNITDMTAFTMYSSPTIDGTIDSVPNPPSLACLSCHDGVSAEGDASAVNSTDTHTLRNAPGPGGVPDINSFPNCNQCHNTGDGIYPRRLWRIGANLMDDHPISITYPTPTQDPDFNTPPDPVRGWPNLKLFNGKVECPTCHDPHNGQPLFLRITNDYSQLCLTCHKK